MRRRNTAVAVQHGDSVQKRRVACYSEMPRARYVHGKCLGAFIMRLTVEERVFILEIYLKRLTVNTC
jgi:hypothetical protein